MPPRTVETDTKTALLDAAEALVAEHGVDGTSLRAVTAKAEANLAAVHYHFGSKQGLVAAVIGRRVEPVNRERLEMLDAAEAVGGGAAQVEAVIRAFVAPALRMGASESREHLLFKRCMARVFSDPSSEVQDLVRAQFAEVAERFPKALARALPELSREVVLWRFHFMLGAVIHLALHSQLIFEHSEGACDPSDPETASERLTAFLLAGWTSTHQDEARRPEGSGRTAAATSPVGPTAPSSSRGAENPALDAAQDEHDWATWQ